MLMAYVLTSAGLAASIAALAHGLQTRVGLKLRIMFLLPCSENAFKVATLGRKIKGDFRSILKREIESWLW